MEGVKSKHPYELRIQGSRGFDLDVGATSRGVGDLDIDVLGFFAFEEGFEKFRRVDFEFVLGIGGGLFREHQRGGIERGLHGRLDRIGTAVIDGGADEANDRQ